LAHCTIDRDQTGHGLARQDWAIGIWQTKMTPQDKTTPEEKPPTQREPPHMDEFRQTLREYIAHHRALLEMLRKRLLH
jgi:hypothetical protein